MGTGSTGNQGESQKGRRPPFEIQFDPAAKEDIAEAVEFYEVASEGLGQRFALTVSKAINRIAENPHLYQRVAEYHRRAVMRNFPYSIFYSVEETARVVLILSVHNDKREPYRWQRRLPPWRRS